MLKYKYVFQIKCAEAILSNSTRKLLWFEVSKMLIAVYEKKFIVSFIKIFGTLSFPIGPVRQLVTVSPSAVISCDFHHHLLRLTASVSVAKRARNRPTR